MKSAAELLASQAKPLCTVTPEATVFEALHLLAKNEVGALAVVDPLGKLMGIVSERDYTRKVALQGKNSRDAKVDEIMTRGVLVVNPKTRARDCMALMSSRKIRHLPVVDGETLLGVLSIRDLMDAIIADQKHTIEQLESYIHS
jgi:CBS domain-containing protein